MGVRTSSVSSTGPAPARCPREHLNPRTDIADIPTLSNAAHTMRHPAHWSEDKDRLRYAATRCGHPFPRFLGLYNCYTARQHPLNLPQGWADADTGPIWSSRIVRSWGPVGSSQRK